MTTMCPRIRAHLIIENLPPARKRKSAKDAVEGFTELLAFLFAEEQRLEPPDKYPRQSLHARSGCSCSLPLVANTALRTSLIG